MTYDEDVKRLKRGLKKRGLSMSQLYDTNGIFNIQKAQERISSYDHSHPKARIPLLKIIGILISLGILIIAYLEYRR